jgi:hypothetical protein
MAKTTKDRLRRFLSAQSQKTVGIFKDEMNDVSGA